MSAPGSAFVAVLRNHAEIVLAHVNRESPNSAALAFPQASHPLGRRPWARTYILAALPAGGVIKIQFAEQGRTPDSSVQGGERGDQAPPQCGPPGASSNASIRRSI